MVPVTANGRWYRASVGLHRGSGTRTARRTPGTRCSCLRWYSTVYVLSEGFLRSWGDKSERIAGEDTFIAQLTVEMYFIFIYFQARPGSKVLPAPYVKVYLVSGKKCIEKAKTTTARKTLDPLYQQQLVFREPFSGCILQVHFNVQRICSMKGD